MIQFSCTPTLTEITKSLILVHKKHTRRLAAKNASKLTREKQCDRLTEKERHPRNLLIPRRSLPDAPFSHIPIDSPQHQRSHQHALAPAQDPKGRSQMPGSKLLAAQVFVPAPQPRVSLLRRRGALGAGLGVDSDAHWPCVVSELRDGGIKLFCWHFSGRERGNLCIVCASCMCMCVYVCAVGCMGHARARSSAVSKFRRSGMILEMR